MEAEFCEALCEVCVDRGVYDYPDVAGLGCCGRWCAVDGVRQGAQFTVEGRPETYGRGVVLQVVSIRTPPDAYGGTTPSGCPDRCPMRQ